MDCYNWRNCEGSCDHCEVAGMEAAKAVQAWDDPEYLVNNWSPEEVLKLLQQLGRQAEVAEQGRQALENHVREMGEELRGSRQQLQEEQEARRRNKEVADAWMATAKRLKRERDELREVLKHAADFILNGIELGYIRKT